MNSVSQSANKCHFGMFRIEWEKPKPKQQHKSNQMFIGNICIHARQLRLALSLAIYSRLLTHTSVTKTNGCDPVQVCWGHGFGGLWQTEPLQLKDAQPNNRLEAGEQRLRQRQHQHNKQKNEKRKIKQNGKAHSARRKRKSILNIFLYNRHRSTNGGQADQAATATHNNWIDYNAAENRCRYSVHRQTHTFHIQKIIFGGAGGG